MDTTAKTTATMMSNNSNWFNNQALSFEKNRFGWMTILLTAQSCLGSVACMGVLQNKASDIFLILCAGITMASNAMFIAQAKPKVCLIVFYLSVLINTVLIIANY